MAYTCHDNRQWPLAKASRASQYCCQYFDLKIINKGSLIRKYLITLSNYYLWQKNGKGEEGLLKTFFKLKEQDDLEFFPFIMEASKDFTPFKIISAEVHTNSWLKDFDVDKVLYSVAFKHSMFPEEMELDTFKAFYKGIKEDSQFETYWKSFYLENWDTFNPPERISEFIANNSKKGDWVLLDIWGTWCGPCLEDLPKLVALEKNIKANKKNNFSFVTLESDSKELTSFMEKNKYRFPVATLSDEELKEMKISHFPTTFLISPNGQYFEFVYLTDKNKIIRNFTLFNF